jgi:hypothetical protein
VALRFDLLSLGDISHQVSQELLDEVLRAACGHHVSSANRLTHICSTIRSWPSAVRKEEDRNMLKDLHVDQARFIALLAKNARMQRDALIGHAADDGLDGGTPARGEHNPTVELGVEPLPPDAAQPAATLGEAITTLPEPARRELYALMRIGQGHLAAKTWHRGVSEAETLGDSATTAAIIDDPDLHDHIMKGLYQAKLAA